MLVTSHKDGSVVILFATQGNKSLTVQARYGARLEARRSAPLVVTCIHAICPWNGNRKVTLVSCCHFVNLTAVGRRCGYYLHTTTKNPALLCASDVEQGMAVKLSKLDPYLKLISEPHEILWLSQFLVPLQE
jgi:hypothetical protein